MSTTIETIPFIDSRGEVVRVTATKEAVDKAYNDGLLPFGEDAMDAADAVDGFDD